MNRMILSGLALTLAGLGAMTGAAEAAQPANDARAPSINLDHTPEFPSLSQPGVTLAPLPGPAVPAPAPPRLPSAPALGLGPVDATIGLPPIDDEATPRPEGRLGLALPDALAVPGGSQFRLEAARPLDFGLSGLLGNAADPEDEAAPRLSLRGEVPAGADSALSLEAHEMMRERAEEAERQIQMRLKMGW